MHRATRKPILAVAALALGVLQAAELAQVRSVYLLPMANGFDQYLAHQLTEQGVLQVVTDPERADAVLTDQIGPAFERRLGELFPPQKEAPAAAEAKEKEKEKEAAEAAEARAESDRQRAATPGVSSFGRGRGNVFLVARESRQVLWSVHQRPKDSTPRELDRAAAKVAARLKASLSGK